jgi:hypothetical protein
MSITTYDEFNQNLVLMILGVNLNDFEAPEQDIMVKECLDIYNSYIKEYFINNYPKVNLDINNIDYRAQNFATEVNYISQKIEVAHSSFTNQLKNSWKLKSTNL